jgi:hypothetical protein
LWFEASPGKHFTRPYLKKKKPSQKRAVEWLSVGLVFKPQYCKKKKRRRKKKETCD